MKALFLTLLVCFFSASSHSSDSRYQTFPESLVQRCSLVHARKPSLNICLTGKASGADLQRAQAWAARSVFTWLRTLKVMDETVTRKIAFTCQDSHLTINLSPGNGTSHASPSQATIYLTRPYATWTHELGHAVAGLSDTYTAGSAGSCGNQPESLMCWGAYGPRSNPDQWSNLWSDDIKGIQSNYLKVFPGKTQKPIWADSVKLEESLSLNEPWPASRWDQDFEDVILKDHRVKTFEGPASEIDYSRDSESIDL